MSISVKQHWHAFWRSGPENLYTFIWWGLFGMAVAGMFWLLSVVASLFAGWKNQFEGAFIGVALVTLLTLATAVMRRSKIAPLVVNGDEDADIMEQRIFLFDVGITEEMISSSAPYINFHLEFINTSIFSITLESFTGRLFVDKEEQKDPLETRPEGHVFQFQRASGVSILLRQWVPPGVCIELVIQAENTSLAQSCESFIYR